MAKRKSYASRGRSAISKMRKYDGFTKRSVFAKRYSGMPSRVRINQKVNNLYRMVETKEGCFTLDNIDLPHNNTYVWNNRVIDTLQGTADPMAIQGQRVGDQINIRGLAATWFIEGLLGRSKVHVRIMLMKGPRGATFDRADVFKGITANKMIDQLNTEKYQIVAQRRFNVSPPNIAPTAVGLNGVPTGGTPAGITGNKIVKFWIPGRKFGKNGRVQFESGTGIPKFYDYRWVFLAYDWFGTPQDLNNVAKVNSGFSKLYFKDA